MGIACVRLSIKRRQKFAGFTLRKDFQSRLVLTLQPVRSLTQLFISAPVIFLRGGDAVSPALADNRVNRLRRQSLKSDVVTAAYAGKVWPLLLAPKGLLVR